MRKELQARPALPALPALPPPPDRLTPVLELFKRAERFTPERWAKMRRAARYLSKKLTHAEIAQLLGLSRCGTQCLIKDLTALGDSPAGNGGGHE